MFIKPLSKSQAKEIETLFKHSMDVWSSLSNTRFVFPRPISKSKNSIAYEFLDLGERLDFLLSTFPDNADIYMVKAGEMLSCIHNNGKATGLLHGDFVLHNIFINSRQSLSLVDPHPPK